ncbi:DUF3043 domain-containing protein [Humidisolicoccus flavus]|uniref:DUF3043 domain-containing protein n=1 Tax=Humidisolicoccus flavus TaxID=3111414 RepID=UPI00324D0745
MPLFNRSKQATDTQATTPEVQVVGKKSTPTPKRSEQVAKLRQPLVPADRKQAQKDARSQMSQLRAEQRAGMEAGVEKYLPMRDRGPVRKYVRDYVDARISPGEIMIPVMVVVILIQMLNSPAANVAATGLLFGFLGLTIIDSFYMRVVLKRRINARFGEGKTKGVQLYATMRSAQMRFMRIPKPTNKRFQFPE